MANTFLTPSVFAQEGLMLLENELILGNKVHTDLSDEFTMVGDTISVRRPTAFLGQNDDHKLFFSFSGPRGYHPRQDHHHDEQDRLHSGRYRRD